MKDVTAVKIAAIISITALETVNMLTGKIDGAVLAAVVTVIAGMAGYTIGKKRA